MRTRWTSRCPATPLLALSLCLSLLWPLAGLRAEMLNGIASYAQLSKEYYLVALYTAAPVTTVEPVLAGDMPMRAELHVVAREWTPYSFGQIWMRDLSINNEISESAPQIEALLRFTRFPQAPLTTGDRIEVTLEPSSGTRIHFNGDLVVEAEGAVLWRYLVNTWVGASPPTRQFREDLLAGGVAGRADLENLATRFAQIATETQRQGLWRRWQAETEQARRQTEESRQRARAAEAAAAQRRADEAARQLAEQREVQARAAQAAAARLQAEAAAAAAQQAALAAREEARRQSERAAQAAERARTEAVAEAERLAEAERRAAELALARQAEEEARARQAAEAVAAGAAAQVEAEAAAQAVAQRRLASLAEQYEQDLYRWHVQRAVQKQVVYPEWARQFGEQGDYTVRFRLDPEGQVLLVDSLEPNETSLLAQELKAALTRAAPFGKLPEGMGYETPFDVSYAFRLRGEPVAPVPKPLMPAELLEQRRAALSASERAGLQETYENEVISRVQQQISYPVWAQNMKQTGRVEIRLTVAADGQISAVELTTPSRHKLLNDEMLAAPQRAAPFDPIPEELGLSTLDLVFEHRFGGR